ncbi:alanine racemase [Microbacterium sp. H1-D42]|uniref:alanine racemase n=1 Tax=Microbacterium sp. H1-D42 TaxID=2925844 RepID=UPI001F535F4F|nr:alanine racemase [Microbacterium sp. H1-D42]UNK70631.1 alanine racemase [Microbacterium sp. H1-D42]
MSFPPPTLQLIRSSVAENIARVQAQVRPPIMAVVKADGYGHGAVPVASAALDAGAEWLGITDVAHAAPLREAGLRAPILAWLNPAGIDAEQANLLRVDVAIGSVDELRALLDQRPTAQRVHLSVDTGMTRGGCPIEDWNALLQLARRGRDAGHITVTGLMGHLPNADRADPRANVPAVLFMRAARDTALRAGFAPVITHLSATSGALTDTGTHFDLVRIGAGLVGIDPSATTTLAAAGRFTAPVVHSISASAGTPVGYGGTHITSSPTRLAVVGVGYADGIPRELSADACVSIDGRRHPIVGRVSMDQIVVDTGVFDYPRGTTVTIFGPDAGAPSVQEWAAWAGTIPHTIVTGIGPRVRRSAA